MIIERIRSSERNMPSSFPIWSWPLNFRDLEGPPHGPGSIDFDLPEPEIVLDMEEGSPPPSSRHPAPRPTCSLREFMVAANEAVAEFVTERKLP
jgi:ribonuclease R